MKIYQNQWKSNEINENLRKFMKIHENRQKSMKICENQYKFVKIDNKSMKINRNRWKSSSHQVIEFWSWRQRRQPLNKMTPIQQKPPNHELQALSIAAWEPTNLLVKWTGLPGHSLTQVGTACLWSPQVAAPPSPRVHEIHTNPTQCVWIHVNTMRSNDN